MRTSQRNCPICGRPLPSTRDGSRHPDVVFSTWTRTYYCGGRRYRRCAEIGARLRRAERRESCRHAA